jgi:hypothetical protein
MSLIGKQLSEKGKPMVVDADYIYTQERTATPNRSFDVKIEVAKVINKPVFLILSKEMYFFS